MQDAPRLEASILRLCERPNLVWAWIILSLVGSVPVVNLVVFGLVFHGCRHYGRTGFLEVKEAESLKRVIEDSLALGLPGLVLLWVFPAIAAVMGAVLDGFMFWQVGAFASVCGAAVLGLGLWAFAALFLAYLNSRNWKSLTKMDVVGSIARSIWPAVWLPILCVMGVLYIFGSVHGVGLFAGLIPFCVYLTDISRRLTADF